MGCFVVVVVVIIDNVHLKPLRSCGGFFPINLVFPYNS